MRKNELYYELIEDEKRGHKTSKYDFSSFVQVKSSSRKRQRKSFGVSVNGELTINAKLLRHFPEYKMDIRISPD